MNEFDTLQRFIIDNKDIRGEIVHLQNTVQSAFENHQYPLEVKIFLGQALCAATLMSATIKYEGKLTIQLQGDGIVNLLLVQVTHERSVRGLIKWEGEVRGKGFQQLIGEAQLSITIEPKNGERYQGLVPLEGERLDECLENYFLQSEQLPTQIWLSADENKAAGFLMQRLPAQDETLSPSEWEHIQILAKTITDDELLNLANETLLYRLFHQETVRLFEKQSVAFRCICSKERCEEAIISLGKEEIDEIIEEGNAIKMTCEFCGKTYQIDLIDLTILKGQAK